MSMVFTCLLVANPRIIKFDRLLVIRLNVHIEDHAFIRRVNSNHPGRVLMDNVAKGRCREYIVDDLRWEKDRVAAASLKRGNDDLPRRLVVRPQHGQASLCQDEGMVGKADEDSGKSVKFDLPYPQPHGIRHLAPSNLVRDKPRPAVYEGSIVVCGIRAAHDNELAYSGLAKSINTVAEDRTFTEGQELLQSSHSRCRACCKNNRCHG